VGVSLDKFQVQQISHGNFYLKFKLCNKGDNFEWVLIAIYGAAQEDEKEFFYKNLYGCVMLKISHLWWEVISTLSGAQKKK
jgi:hypothetical protein